MQFIVILLLATLSAFSKGDYCSFSSEFAEKYMDARKNYADRIKDYRATHPHSKNDSGKMRYKEMGKNWPEVSLKKTVNKLFRTGDIEIKVKGNGKMLIYPKKVRDGAPIIIFDPSGDYFRIVKAKTQGGMVMDTHEYFDLNGKPMPEPDSKNRALFNQYAIQTHFHANP